MSRLAKFRAIQFVLSILLAAASAALAVHGFGGPDNSSGAAAAAALGVMGVLLGVVLTIIIGCNLEDAL